MINHSRSNTLQNCGKNTPNMLELLFCEDESIVSSNKKGNPKDARQLFLHQGFMDCYVGDAKGQLQKAKVPTNRGRGRQELVKKFGYDTKFAMHTIRTSVAASSG